jgi:hypoxanthine-guanine phosphoribosyltransferase
MQVIFLLFCVLHGNIFFLAQYKTEMWVESSNDYWFLFKYEISFKIEWIHLITRQNNMVISTTS